ncbi:MAG: hypothetical protein M3P53_10945 [Actinomycetota bacterium]|nr:hypothetical protein [Actinomycetota bacterium]
MEPEFPAFRELPEPLLAFGQRTGTRGIVGHPLVGLVNHGPYTLKYLDGYIDSVCVALVAPPDQLHIAKRLVTEMRKKHQPNERRDYLIDYPGFHRVFGLDISTAPADCTIALPGDLEERLDGAADPRHVLTGALAEAIAAAAARRTAFDVLMVRLPERWSEWFYGDGDDFDLHDFIKVTAADHGIATQIIRDSALTYPDRCSVAWRLSIATYTKAGGVPWKLADTAPNTMFVGIGYALSSTGRRRFAIGAAQVFDERGAGLQFVGSVAAEDDGTRIDGANPYLTRPQMQTLLGRALNLYQHQHGGKLPHRVVVHKSTPWKKLETEGAFDALGRVRDVELVRVQVDTPWRGVRGTGKGSTGTADSWPLHRGTLVYLDGTELLLWTQGNAPSVSGTGGNFYKEGRGIPHPIILKRWAGHSRAEEVAGEVLALSKMDWNNDGLYNIGPVTLAYAAGLARIMKMFRDVPTDPRPFRWFM